MIKKILFLSAIFVGMAAGQAPDCYLNFRLTAAATTSSYQNTYNACQFWQISYTTTNASALSIQFESASDANGTPATFGLYSGTTTAGSNPSTATGTAQSTFSGLVPWVRINLTSLTGTNANVIGQIFGWRTFNPTNPGGGGAPGGSPNTIQYNSAGSFGGLVINSTATRKMIFQVSSGVPFFDLLQSSDIPNNAANTSGTAANITGTLPLSQTSGTLPHASLPTLLAGDIPNNGANTTGTASGFTATPTLCSTGSAPTGVTAQGNATGCAAIGSATLPSSSTSNQILAIPQGSGSRTSTLVPQNSLLARVVPNCANTPGTSDNAELTRVANLSPGGEIFIPDGLTCYVDNWTPPAGTHIIGQPGGRSVIQELTSGSANSVLNLTGASQASPLKGISIEHITVNGNSGTGGSNSGIIKAVFAQGLNMKSVSIGEAGGTPSATNGLFIQDSSGEIKDSSATGMSNSGLRAHFQGACTMPDVPANLANPGGRLVIDNFRAHDITPTGQTSGDGIFIDATITNENTISAASYAPTWCDSQQWNSFVPTTNNAPLNLPIPSSNSSTTNGIAPGFMASYMNGATTNNFVLTANAAMNLNGSLGGTLTIAPNIPTTVYLADTLHWIATVPNSQSGNYTMVPATDCGTELAPGVIVFTGTSPLTLTLPNPLPALFGASGGNATNPTMSYKTNGAGCSYTVVNNTNQNLTVQTLPYAVTNTTQSGSNVVFTVASTTGLINQQALKFTTLPTNCPALTGTYFVASGFTTTTTFQINGVSCTSYGAVTGTVQTNSLKIKSGSQITSFTEPATKQYFFYSDGFVTQYIDATTGGTSTAGNNGRMGTPDYPVIPATIKNSQVYNINGGGTGLGQVGNGIHLYQIAGVDVVNNDVTATTYSNYRSSAAGPNFFGGNKASNSGDSNYYTEYRSINNRFIGNQGENAGDCFHVTNYNPNAANLFQGAIVGGDISDNTCRFGSGTGIYVEGGTLVSRNKIDSYGKCGIQSGNGSYFDKNQIVDNYIMQSMPGLTNYWNIAPGVLAGGICLQTNTNGLGGVHYVRGNRFDSQTFNTVNGGAGTIPPIVAINQSALSNGGALGRGALVSDQSIPFALLGTPDDGSFFSITGSTCTTATAPGSGSALHQVIVANAVQNCL